MEKLRRDAAKMMLNFYQAINYFSLTLHVKFICIFTYVIIKKLFVIIYYFQYKHKKKKQIQSSPLPNFEFMQFWYLLIIETIY